MAKIHRQEEGMNHNHNHDDQPVALDTLILDIIINGGSVVFGMIFSTLILNMALTSP
jgi:hypothetical protein